MDADTCPLHDDDDDNAHAARAVGVGGTPATPRSAMPSAAADAAEFLRHELSRSAAQLEASQLAMLQMQAFYL